MKWVIKGNARDWFSCRYRNVPFSTGKAIHVQEWKGPECSRRL